MTQAGYGSGAERPSPEMIAELVRSLAVVMHETAVTELDLDLGDVNVRMRRPSGARDVAIAALPAEHAALPRQDDEAGHLITAPMIGTFYTSPTPGALPFVRGGDEVFAGQTIGIIEAMKIMNEIAADRSGIVQAILAGNGQPVEFGSPLIRLAASGSARS